MAELTLYSANVCPFAQRTRLMLLEKGIDFELVEIDLEKKPDWFQDISPYGKVPVLKHGEDLVWESAIINEYLEELFPDPPLLPEKPGLRAWARFWIDFANTSFVPAFYKLLLEQDPDKRAKRRETLVSHMRFMDHEGLGRFDGPWWLGERLSLVDLAFYPFFERLPVLEHFRGVTLPAECRRLSHWLEAMRRLEPVQRIMNPPEFYVQRYTHYADGSAKGRTAQDMRSV